MPVIDRESAVSNQRVSEHWDKQFAKIRADDSCWINSTIVASHLYRLISGGSERHWLEWLFRDYFRKVKRFERSLTICCGDGSHELAMYQTGKVGFVRGFDISEGAVSQAKARFSGARIPEDAYLFEVKDANHLEIEDRVDLVLSTRALHHVTNLEELIRKIRDILRPTGYFVLLEFVGPNRFQGTGPQCDVINGILEQLDPYYLKDHTRVQLSPPPVTEMLRIDPSEAVRSQEIVPLVRRNFAVEYESKFNGTIMHMLYPLLNTALGNKGDRDFDSLVRLILHCERILVDAGLLASDFIFMICRRKGERSLLRRLLRRWPSGMTFGDSE